MAASKTPDQTPVDPNQEPPEPTETAKAAQVAAAQKTAQSDASPEQSETAKAAQVAAAQKTAQSDASPEQSEEKIKVKVVSAYKVFHDGTLYAKDSTIEGTKAELDALIQSKDAELVE
jgi:hypothetical protein